MRRNGPGDLPVPGADPLGPAAGLRRAVVRPAGLVERALQALVDLAVLLLLLTVPWLLVVLAVALTSVPAGLALTAGAVASVVVVTAVVLWPLVDDGRSPGMRWARLRLLTADGSPPGGGALVLRALLLPVDAVVGPLLVLAGPDRRRLGDLAAGTALVHDTTADAGPARPVVLSAAGAPARPPGTARSPRVRSR